MQRRECLNAAVALWDRLEAEPRTVGHNDPRRGNDRFSFLRLLNRSGMNDFNAYPASLMARTIRFPVFVRHRWDHSGALTSLIDGPWKLRLELLKRAITSSGDLSDPHLKDLLIVEHLDVSVDGIFRKYSAFRVGDRIIPRHVFFSWNWMQKGADLIEPELLEEEERYVSDNPHEKQLRDYFDLANLKWGRIDYGLFGDRLQAWEINTGPGIVPPGEWGPRAGVHELFLGRLRAALEELEESALRPG
jgi:hypothetical protein